MTTDRWTDAKLDTLADTVEQLVHQVQQLSQHLGQLGTRLDQTTYSLDALVTAIANSAIANPAIANPAIAQPSPPEAPPPPSEPQANWLARITLLEEQLLHLTQRVQSLERRGFSVSTVATAMSIAADEDDEIEDEPDEILWDFMEPNADRG